MSSAQKVAIVTGATQGLGHTVVVELLKKSWRVVATGRQQGVWRLSDTDDLKFVQGDIADSHTVEVIGNTARDTFGRVDALILNAAMLDPLSLIADGNAEGWRRHFDVNLFSCVALCAKTLPLLRESRGKIIAVSSGASKAAYSGWSAYCCSKAALNMLVEGLGKEEREVTSLSLRPGVVDTAMQTKVREEGKQAMGPEHKRFVDLHQEGKLLKPEVPAAVIVTLAAHAPHEWSGSYISWDEEKVKALMQAQEK